METRRRERGRLGSVLCPEFLYWAFSGYGIGYLRALIVLVCLIVIAASIYMFWGGGAFKNDFFGSLLFSLQVATLQKPLLLSGATDLARWVYALESIVVPVQAALFVLALRMRLKR
jgi:hypothetical protein